MINKILACISSAFVWGVFIAVNQYWLKIEPDAYLMAYGYVAGSVAYVVSGIGK